MPPTAESSTSTTPFLVRQISVPAGPAPVIAPTVQSEAGTPVDTAATQEVPVDIFEAHRGHPYAADLFDMTSNYGKTGFGAELKLIDSYVLSEIAERQLKPTKESYHAVVSRIESDMGLDPNLLSDVRAKQIAKYISILTAESKLATERKQLLNAKP